MKAFLAPGLFLVTLSVILFIMNRVSARNRLESDKRYGFDEAENNLPILFLFVLGLIGTGIGVYGYFFQA